MEQKALRLEKEVWPLADARQWVLTFPMQVRRWLAHSSDLLSAVIRLVSDEISKFYIKQTPDLDDEARASEPSAGGITFIQRFNSALDLSTHLHIVFMGKEEIIQQSRPSRILVAMGGLAPSHAGNLPRDMHLWRQDDGHRCGD